MSESIVSKFYDLHTTGLGYLNRVRMVKPKKGDQFIACSISALRGEWKSDGSVKPDYTKYDVRVYGQDAITAIEFLKPFGDEKRKVMIQFKLGDTYPELFVYDKDTDYHKKGDHGVMIKGRLLKIANAWVDGERVELPSSSSTQLAANPEQGQPEQGQPEQGQPEQGQPEQGQPDQDVPLAAAA